MRETSVLYQQMLRAYISECKRDPGATNLPRLATRRHVCVHVVYLAGSKLCEMGEMGVHMGEGTRERLPVLSVGSDNQPLSVTQEHRCARNGGGDCCRSDSPSRTPLSVDWHWRSSLKESRKIDNESQSFPLFLLRARDPSTSLYPRFSQLLVQTTKRCCSVRFHDMSRFAIVNDE